MLPLSGSEGFLAGPMRRRVHAHLAAGQTALINGVTGAVGSLAVQLAREAGAHVIATGRPTHRDFALGLGAHSFVDTEELETAARVDVVLDVVGGDLLDRSLALLRPAGTAVTITAPHKDSRALFFVVEPDRTRLAALAQHVREGRLKPVINAVRPLDEAPAAVTHRETSPGKTIIQVR